MLNAITILLLISVNCFALTGEVSLGGGQSNQPQEQENPAASQKKITVTSVGESPTAAEKQAITDAVRQAVGAYIDSNTIVQNEEVIRDRILSVSDGFVKEYKPTAPAHKREDGLYEITIEATVETKKVVQALKENNIISGEVAGQNLWAEASTKVMNAQDAVTMLETKIPELIKSVVTITPLDKDGKPFITKDASGKEMPNTAPAVVDSDASTGEATLTWYFEMGVDKSYYAETLFPLVNKCLDAIMGDAPVKMEVKLQPQTMDSARVWTEKCSHPDIANAQPLPVKQLKAFFEPGFGGSFLERSAGFIIIKSVSRNLDLVEIVYHKNPQNIIKVQSGKSSRDGYPALAALSVQLLASDGEKLASNLVNAWQPFSTFGNTLNIIGPFCKSFSNDYFKSHFYRPIIQKVSIKVPIEMLKEIKKVDVSLQPSEMKLSLKPIR